MILYLIYGIYFSKKINLSGLLAHSSALGNAGFILVMFGQFLANSALMSYHFLRSSADKSSSATIAFVGHSGIHTAQSIHSSG